MDEEISNLLPPQANHPYIHLNCFIFTINTKTIKAAIIMYLLKLILQLVCFLNCSLRFFLLAEANNNDISSVQYLKHTCSTNNKTTFPPNNSAYRSNLHTLLTTLHTHATTAEFYSTTAPGGGAGETIYGMFMCRGDVTNRTCQNCTGIATREIASRCPNSKEAIIWYHECFVRYSNRYLLSKVEEWPRHKFMNYSVTTNSTKQGSYGWLLANTLSDAVGEAANAGPVGTKKFATKHASLGLGGPHSSHNNNRNDDDEVYTLVQCTPDLTRQDCRRCLGDIMKDIPLCCLGRDCGMVLYPSCSLMFGIDQFYRDVDRTQPPSTNNHIPPSKEQIARSSLKMIIPAVILMTILAVFFANHVRRIKALRRYKAILEENFGDESTSLESLQFDLATLEAATNKFSPENMVGEGGFGKVYKGTLSNGREVAIKRLSSCSSQGAIEFKNEVLSIARLQHRNLVTLLGFCLQENEKMLVYEFVPNKSLDYFLFDPQNERLLNWYERYNIVVGIARAILYLHQYSRLKIIHRDIKPSNILLDNNMSPKISDFGMAKMVALDQDQGRTRRIVGTYGYMSPEYAMLGNFSEKSDVFSFGVMILEIISGKRNYGSHKSYFVDGLLSYAWRQWKDGTPIEILDTNLRDSCSQNEVIKCIKIGLLCVQENPEDRPHMATVVSYLSNISIELPIPREPAFYIDDDKVEPNLVEVDLDFGSVRYSSVNEMSISRSFPR